MKKIDNGIRVKKCERLYEKAGKFVTEISWNGWEDQAEAVNWNSKGLRLMRRLWAIDRKIQGI
jgi:hypothetical protein